MREKSALGLFFVALVLSGWLFLGRSTVPKKVNFKPDEPPPKAVLKPVDSPKKGISWPEVATEFLVSTKSFRFHTNGFVSIRDVDRDSIFTIHCDSVESLHFVMSDETVFPKQVFRFKNLKKLWVGMRLYKKIPPEIALLQKLEYVDFQHSALDEIPDEFCQLKNLRIACFLFTDITALPENFGDLENLEDLSLSRTAGISKLPGNMKKLQKLQQLVIGQWTDRPHLSEEEYQKLKSGLPNCRILWIVDAPFSG